MIKIAIVEDDELDSSKLKTFIKQYEMNNPSFSFEIITFSNPIVFIDSYSFDFDLIFLDIKMPEMNGMDLAKKIREKDKNVILFFITSLGQYAIKGYEVEALDFLVKPIQYSEFALKFDRAVKRIHKSNLEESIVVTYKGNSIRLSINEITYVEAIHHRIVYHTDSKREFMSLGTLKSVIEKLNSNLFSLCNKCYLVNLKLITNIDDTYCYLGNEKLLISRPRKKEFKQAFVNYLQGNSK